MSAGSLASSPPLRQVAGPLSVALALAVALPCAAHAADPEAGPGKPATEASIERSTLRGLTYKAGTFLTNIVAYSLSTGDMVQGMALSVGLTAYSTVTYVATDYFWDRSYPQTHAGESAPEVLKESAERTTWKYLTYKAVNIPAMLTTSYLATGTAAGMVGMATGLSVLKAGLFYGNNMVWDYVTPPPPRRAEPVEEAHK